MIDTTIRLADRRATMMLYNNEEAVHGAVYSGFPIINGRVLYRLDEDKAGRFIMVRSESMPDYTRVVEDYGWPRLAYEDQVASIVVDGDHSVGERLDFKLRGNAVKRNNGKDYHIRSIDDRIAWLLRKSEDNGFKVVSVAVTSTGRVRVRKEGMSFTFDSTDYAGRLVVTDAERFKSSLENGIGRKKGYGMGMMIV